MRHVLLSLIAAGLMAADSDLAAINRIPCADWINVRTAMVSAAVGDGVADDTVAIQAALNRLGGAAQDPRTVYFPPGIYRITKTLENHTEYGAHLVGHGRDSVLRWDGAAGAQERLLWVDGAAYAHYDGLSFDGADKAGIGIDYSSLSRFVTESDHEHLAFRRFRTAGVRVGKSQLEQPHIGQASAELIFADCLFADCAVGFQALTFNDYDNVFSGCEFRHCGVGVMTKTGSNAYVRDSQFIGSTTVDILAERPEHPSSIRRCISQGSRRFLDWSGGVSTLAVLDCRIDAWSAGDGAMVLGGQAPVQVVDCVFTQAPAAAVNGNGSKPIRNDCVLVLSNNLPAAREALLADTSPAANARVTEVPAGARGANLNEATCFFPQSPVPTPPVVFDARRDFGAHGDGVADDTVAIQNAVAAAKAHGGGALAYLPGGTYRVTATIDLSGSDYAFGGAGTHGVNATVLRWQGAAGGTTVHVHDADRVRLQRLTCAGADRPGAERPAADIVQDGQHTGRVDYEAVCVHGTYANAPGVRGLRLTGLGRGALVHLRHLTGNLTVTDCARARILTDVHWEGAIIVEGRADAVRDGFFGVSTRFNSFEPFGLYVRDNHSAVLADYYTESADGYLNLSGTADQSGSSDLPPGRVTVAGIKLQCAVQPEIRIDDYGGQVSLLGVQFYQAPDPREIRHRGTAPCALLLVGCRSYGPRVNVITDPGDGSSTAAIACQWDANGPAEDASPVALTRAAQAYDDLRALGALDLEVNFPSSR